MTTKRIAVVGIGWVGEAIANQLERDGHPVTRYDNVKEPYIGNKHLVPECSIVFLSVPTPTTKKGFDDSMLIDAASNVGEGKIAVVKSTVRADTVEKLQRLYPKIFVFSNPEFLREASAAVDVANPERNIIGTPVDNDLYRQKAQEVLDLLPPAKYQGEIVDSRVASLVKSGGNVFLNIKILFANSIYDRAVAEGVDPSEVLRLIGMDHRIGPSHMKPVDDQKRRGAAGHCLLKDFEAYKRRAAEVGGYTPEVEMLEAMIRYNLWLLRNSGKDPEIVEDVYGHLTDEPELFEPPLKATA